MKLSKTFLRLLVINLGKEINDICLKFLEDAEEYHEELIAVSRLCARETFLNHYARKDDKAVENFKKTIVVYGKELIEKDDLLRRIMSCGIAIYDKKFYMIYILFHMMKQGGVYKEITSQLDVFWAWSGYEIFYDTSYEDILKKAAVDDFRDSESVIEDVLNVKKGKNKSKKNYNS